MTRRRSPRLNKHASRLRRRLWLVPTALLVCLGSCDAQCARAAEEIAAMIAAVVIVLIIVSICFSVVFLASLVGGIVTSVLNVTSPSRRSAIAGLVFGSLNGLLGLLTLVGAASAPFTAVEERPPTQVEPAETTDIYGQPNEPYAVSEPPPASRGPGVGELIGSIVFALFWLALGGIGIGTSVRALGQLRAAQGPPGQGPPGQGPPGQGPPGQGPPPPHVR